jgi:PAS domain S-box-containing protein
MKNKSVGTNSTVTLRLESTMRRFGLLLPLLTVIYGIFVDTGWVEGSAFYSPLSFGLYLGASVVLALIQVSFRRTTVLTKGSLLVAHHVLLALALLYVFGVLTPVILMWLLLIIVTMSFFGRRWALVSYSGLLALMSIDILLTHTDEPSALATYGIYGAFLGAIALIFSSLRTIEVSEQTKFEAAKARQYEQREALLTIINGTTQAIFTVSSTGHIRIYNAALLALIDTNQSLSGRKVDEVISLLDDKGESISLYEMMKTKPRFDRDDLRLSFTDGDEIRLHLSVNKIQSSFSADQRHDGEGYVCIARDVTKQKSLEEERDEFISVISHELRTPVTIAEGTISNVQYFLENGADAAKLVPSLKDAHDQIIMLANMINDLGTLSRAERGVGDQVESIDIKELAQTIYKNYADSAKKKGLKLDIDLGVKLGSVTTSRLYLEELLQNLITNAIKYTATGSVTLHVKRTSSGTEFAVKDTGIGISKTDLKHVFEKFYRSEDYRTRETSGTGLGLYVVTKLMHKLGTKVEVSSRLNHGSTFSFVLPDATPITKT